MADEQDNPNEEPMTNEANLPVADDAVSNRSDDTALDEAESPRAGAQGAIEPLASDESALTDQDDDAAVEPVIEEQAAYEAAEAEADRAGEEDSVAAEPVRRSRGPVEETLPVEEEIRMDWYILKVQSNRERSIAEALERKMRIEGLDRFFDQVIVPTEKVTEFKGGKKKVVERKLYPGYIVVHMHINDDTWFAVRETSGVGDFTGAGGKPTPMLPQEVARIIQTEEEETSEAPKLDIRFARGDKVKVKEGNFESFEGEVNTIDEASGRVTVMINIFGRSTPVELEYWQIEAV
ncbi:MAG: transcription termination/antitermination protein NusG [Planctomycetes bacterium]|nr:transcription termination/antitermination protein NusG [Planctomycetota bacterium]